MIAILFKLLRHRDPGPAIAALQAYLPATRLPVACRLRRLMVERHSMLLRGSTNGFSTEANDDEPDWIFCPIYCQKQFPNLLSQGERWAYTQAVYIRSPKALPRGTCEGKKDYPGNERLRVSIGPYDAVTSTPPVVFTHWSSTASVLMLA